MSLNVNAFIKKIDSQITYLEYSNFYEDMSKITDINYFIQVMKTKEGEEKRKIEEGIICLSSQENLKDYEKIFLDKYHKYLTATLEKDIREYYNNYYCGYLYSKAWSSININHQSQEIKFINGKTLEEIDIILTNTYNKLMEKLYSGRELDEEDKRFIEETFLTMAFNDIIYKEYAGEKDLMYDIVEFFKKYPIKNISNPRNKQLDILKILSSEMLDFTCNCAIQFENKRIYNENGKETLGDFLIPYDINEPPIIKINGLDTYEIKTDKEYLEKIFSLYHEIRHFYQHIKLNEYPEEMQRIILREIELIKTNRTFYEKNHDSFYVEIDADNYASIQLLKEYGEKYPKIAYDIVYKKRNKKRIDFSKFIYMELEEYDKLQQTEQKKLRN